MGVRDAGGQRKGAAKKFLGDAHPFTTIPSATGQLVDRLMAVRNFIVHRSRVARAGIRRSRGSGAEKREAVRVTDALVLRPERRAADQAAPTRVAAVRGLIATLGAVVKTGAAAKVSIAVLGVFATVVVFPALFALIVGAAAAYAAPLFVVPRLWRGPRAPGAKFGLTVGVIIGTALVGLVLNAIAVTGITWIADRDPCAAFRAGVTGSVRPSDECLRGG